MEFLYTLCFIKREDALLMLNRNKQPWLGIWNGIGGKRMSNESALSCIQREVFEETGINLSLDRFIDKGYVTWNDDFKTPSLGLHVFFVEVEDTFEFQTPLATDEGILDWKKINWVNNKENLGVSYNIPYFIHNVLYNQKRFQYHCIFDGNLLVEVKEYEL